MRISSLTLSVTRLGTVGAPPDPSAPVNVDLPVITGTARVGETLACSEGAWAAYPGPTITYQWRADGVDLSGETADTLLLTADEYEAEIDCVVTATNSEGDDSAIADSVGPVAGLAPVNTVAPEITGTPAYGEELTCDTGTWTGVPGSFTYAYLWSSGETTATIEIGEIHGGRTLTCVVTATNDAGSTPAVSNGVSVPVFGIPVIDGVPTVAGDTGVGDVLTATPAPVAANPTATRTWQWTRNGADISGSTASTHTIVAGDVGANLRVRQIETNAVGFSSATSAPVFVPGESSEWILNSGYWDDQGVWVDDATWKDGP